MGPCGRAEFTPEQMVHAANFTQIAASGDGKVIVRRSKRFSGMTTGCLLLLLAVGGCSLGRVPGVSGDGARRFYLTKSLVPGDQAAGACASGFHMGSRFELTDPSLLAYDTVLGLTTEDSGSGPPSAAAVYGAPGPLGWVRTGGSSQYSDPGGTPGSAFTNCSAWSTASHDAFGTIAFLGDHFGAPLWDGGSRRCDQTFHVWCVENRISPPESGSGEGERGRHRRGGGDE